tara:strand:+ start:1053 stop:1244 length:192 start_codon:yes stop_codon:yes gene_type:complete
LSVYKKTRRLTARSLSIRQQLSARKYILTLTSFEPTVRFIDYIGAAFAADHPAITMALFQGFK